ncbi:hypothetical protein AB0C77_31515 [Streptomyces sp. NPDC048629]|uniref:hypothetical protein n=1 Tax=Streptomyces sp. NPDC048629 TaxID=3154824 RepID=UPI003428ECAA
MFNRIRRALSRTRRRHLPARHRRPLTPTRQTVVHLGAANWHRDRTDVIAGEETALVRPYVLAAEGRARRRSAAAPQDLFAYTWFAPAEAH